MFAFPSLGQGILHHVNEWQDSHLLQAQVTFAELSGWRCSVFLVALQYCFQHNPSGRVQSASSVPCVFTTVAKVPTSPSLLHRPVVKIFKSQAYHNLQPDICLLKLECSESN
jgi:hypothetical protein